MKSRKGTFWKYHPKNFSINARWREAKKLKLQQTRFVFNFKLSELTKLFIALLLPWLLWVFNIAQKFFIRKLTTDENVSIKDSSG